jgi:hypothetical protein
MLLVFVSVIKLKTLTFCYTWKCYTKYLSKLPLLWLLLTHWSKGTKSLKIRPLKDIFLSENPEYHTETNQTALLSNPTPVLTLSFKNKLRKGHDSFQHPKFLPFPHVYWIVSQIEGIIFLNGIEKVGTNIGRRIAEASRFCTVTPNLWILCMGTCFISSSGHLGIWCGS